jgi:hypothetical protein
MVPAPLAVNVASPCHVWFWTSVARDPTVTVSPARSPEIRTWIA